MVYKRVSNFRVEFNHNRRNIFEVKYFQNNLNIQLWHELYNKTANIFPILF